MNRRRDDLQKIDTSAWAAVDPNALAAAKRKTFEARYEAINLYATGQTLREIEKQTSINSRQLYGLLDRCLTQADDGRLVGFRGLLKHDRFGSYARTAKLPAEYSASGKGLAGAFAFLLEQHPPLAQWLTQKIRKRAVTLHQVSTDGPLKTRLSKLANLHAGFLTQCRAVGITAADYPLNTDRMGIRSLSAYVTAKILTNFGDAARTAGATHLKGMPGAAGRGAVRPYQVVEFDGHQLDVRLKIVIRDPLGFEQEFEIERIWLLVIIDVCTRAVLGFRRALADPKGNLRLFVSLAEMEELMEASIAGYNATPHDGLNGRTPLEAMEYLVRGKGQMIWWLPEAKRRTMCLMQTAHRCRVRGYLVQGTRPHINLFQVRYTSDVLAASGVLLGRELRIYYNSDDLRTVRAFLSDGSELGILKAQGAWGEIRHDLKLRREIMKLRAKKRLAFTVTQEFIDRFVEEKRKKAKHSRRAASDLERTMRTLANAPTTNTPPGPPKSGPVAPAAAPPATTDSALPAQTPQKIEPLKLTIPSGFTTVI